MCTLTEHWGPVTSVAYSPDGKHIASGSYDNTVKSLGCADWQGGECLWFVLAYRLLLRALMLTSVLVHEQECTLTGHSDSVRSVAYSPDGKHIVSGSWDKHREGLGFSDRQGGECPTLSSPYRLLLRAVMLTSVFGP